MSKPVERLKAIIPHLKLAMSMAKIQVPNGIVALGVIAKSPDGGGRITASFDGEDFFNDLETVVGDVLAMMGQDFDSEDQEDMDDGPRGP